MVGGDADGAGDASFAAAFRDICFFFHWISSIIDMPGGGLLGSGADLADAARLTFITAPCDSRKDS